MLMMSSRIAAAAALLLAIAALPARAGEYHWGATLNCSDCHSMHGTQSHAWDDAASVATTGAPNGNWIASGAPFPYLLKADTIDDVCIACHDGKTFAPDVVGDHSNGYVREAGGIATSSNGYSGHKLNGIVETPGGSASTQLHCISCHKEHGSTAFRNIDNITYAKGTNDPTKDVYLRSFVIGNLANNYSVDSVDFNETNARISKYATFCAGCHVFFHGNSFDPNMRDQDSATGTGWLRHPTTDANIGGAGGGRSSLAQFASKPYRVKVLSNAGWGTQGSAWSGTPSTLTPSCMSCHKAHGNKNPFALIYMTGTSAATEEGDGSYVDLCRQCHVQ
jgi:hypothetical protein